MKLTLEEIEQKLYDSAVTAREMGFTIIERNCGNYDSKTCCPLASLAIPEPDIFVFYDFIDNGQRLGLTKEETWAFVAGFDGQGLTIFNRKHVGKNTDNLLEYFKMGQRLREKLNPVVSKFEL